MKFVSLPLRDLLRGGVSSQLLQEKLNGFRCERDTDVARFLQLYAIDNERLGASRSYLIADREALDSDGTLRLVAFFTLAITSTDYSSVSNRAKRRILGDYPRVSREGHFPGYLLAQLARDDRFTRDDLDCSNLLSFAESIVDAAADAVGGNLLYLDCKEPLVGYYERFGYTALPHLTHDGFFKMFKSLSGIS
ncbi:MAG: hypothetical protein HFJ72_05230 [Adlercreutzia sp.]|nr:hypothetical protein [Adlercreutzia sp.]